MKQSICSYCKMEVPSYMVVSGKCVQCREALEDGW